MELNAITQYDQFNWGDPFLNQLVGSDSQASGSDPAGYFLAAASSGPDQIPAVVSATSGSAPATNAQPESCAWWQTVLYGCGVLPRSTGNTPLDRTIGGSSAPAPPSGGCTLTDWSGCQGIVGNWGRDAALVLLAIVLIAIGIWTLVK